MGVRKEQIFLSEHFPGDITKCIHSASNTVERNNGKEARNEFISFCNEAFEKTDAGFDIIDPIHCKCTQWQNSRYIMCYMWYPFMRHEARDDFCCVSFAMEKFYDGDYKLMMKFEINDEGMDDEASFDRFRKVVEDLRPEGMQYVIYPNSGIADKDGEEDGERFMGFDAALEKYNNIRDKKQKKKKRICPAALIADSDEMDDDELMFERAAKAIDELSKYYDAYYDGLTAGGPHGSGEKKENGTEKRTMKEIPKNIILYGPPGTGKTYNTVFWALELMGEKHDRDDYAGAKSRYDELVGDGRIKFVTFHQSYGYEEFIEGIRPSTDEHGNIRYDVRDGVFKKFCDDARKDMGDGKDESKDVPYVFIIDEINRGNISKIFGELITLIEDNKREGEKEAAKALLLYPKKGENGEETEDYFSVPRNVYIIGTMNTADRSITSLDTALRRRFVFEEMMPDPDAIKTADGKPITVEGVNVPEMLRKMNERIEALYDREHQIGHAYFMDLIADPSPENLSGIFKNKIIPLLQEYFFDDYAKIRTVLADDRPGTDETEQFITEKSVPDGLFASDADTGDMRVYRINGGALNKSRAYRKIYE